MTPFGPLPANSALRSGDGPNTAIAYIRPGAIANNLHQLRQRLSLAGTRTAPRVWAVVKADAYGHGVGAALAGLAQADGIAVTHLDEAYRCRSLKWRKPILIMSACFKTIDLGDPVLFPLHLVIDSEWQLAELENSQPARPPHVWLRYRGTLNHAGFEQDLYEAAYNRLQKLLHAGRLAGLGHLQHYAHAEEPELLHAERSAFTRLFAHLPGPRCTENSAALLLDPGFATEADWVRSGVALYGISPLPDVSGPSLDLQAAMTLVAPIYAVQQLSAGQSVGYGGIFRAPRTMRIGLVRCGYADGYPRNISENCPVLINNRPSRIIGRVSMDTLTIALDEHPDAGPGTMVTLWGVADLPIEVVARSAATIAAQLCSGITARIPRLISQAD